ncbi:MAG: clostripain-related cysteine peptidase [Candidatus Muiribacteriota bacterium]
MKKTMLFLLVLSLIALTISAQEAKKWTVMVYIAGDNDLDYSLKSDVNELELIGSSDDVNIIVLFDRWSGRFEYNQGGNPHYVRDENNKGMKIYYIEEDDNPDVIASQDITESLGFEAGIFNSGDAKNLEKFVKAVIKNYPAENYHLDIGTHGNGIEEIAIDHHDTADDIYVDASMNLGISENNSLTKALMNTFGRNYSGMLGKLFGKLVDVIQGRNPGLSLGVFSMDACLMSMIEIYFDLAHARVEYAVASEETIPGVGFNYDDFFSDIADKTPRQHAIDMPTRYYNFYSRPENRRFFNGGINLAAIELNKNNFADYLNHMGDIFSNLNNAYDRLSEEEEQIDFMKKYHVVLRNTRKFTEGYYLDAIDFLDKLSADEELAAIAFDDDKLNITKNSLSRTILNNKTVENNLPAWNNEVHGISIYLPKYYTVRYMEYTADQWGGNLSLTKQEMTDNSNLKYSEKLEKFSISDSKFYREYSKFSDNYLNTMGKVAQTPGNSSFFTRDDRRDNYKRVE